MSFQDQRIEILEAKIAELQRELTSLQGGVKPYDFRVVEACQQHLQLPDIAQKSRAKRYVKARALAAHVLRKGGYSLPEIGAALGRDHGSIYHLLKNHIPLEMDIAAVKRIARTEIERRLAS